VSFAIYFFTILKADAGTDYLQNFHNQYFFDLLPTNVVSLEQNYTLLIGLFRGITDKTTVSLLAAFLFFGIGVYQLSKDKKFESALLLLPFLFCLIASHFNMYSLLTRLTLFLIPILTLVFGYGFSWAWKNANKPLKVVLLSFILLSLINKKAYEHFWKPLELEDSKTTLTYLHENKKENEPIFVHHSGVPAFVFYNEMHDKAFHLQNYHLGKWNEVAGTHIRHEKKLQKGDKFWLFFSHTEPIERLNKDFQSVQKIATKMEEKTAIQSIVQCYVVK